MGGILLVPNSPGRCASEPQAQVLHPPDVSKYMVPGHGELVDPRATLMRRMSGGAGLALCGVAAHADMDVYRFAQRAQSCSKHVTCTPQVAALRFERESCALVWTSFYDLLLQVLARIWASETLLAACAHACARTRFFRAGSVWQSVGGLPLPMGV